MQSTYRKMFKNFGDFINQSGNSLDYQLGTRRMLDNEDSGLRTFPHEVYPHYKCDFT